MIYTPRSHFRNWPHASDDPLLTVSALQTSQHLPRAWPSDLPLRRSSHVRRPAAVTLMSAGFLVIWLSSDVRGFRLVLARGWHGTPWRPSACKVGSDCRLPSLGSYYTTALPALIDRCPASLWSALVVRLRLEHENEILPRMALHTDFWVVAGAASPVILLAAVVSSAEALSTRLPVPVVPKRREKQTEEIPNWLYFINTVNSATQIVFLFISLQSLAWNRDYIPPSIVSWTELVVLVVFFASTILAARIRDVGSQIKENPKGPIK